MGETRERILLASLRLFARDGYEGVSVSDISGALGMTKGALYRHYRSKRDIFDAIVRRMEQRDLEQARVYGVPEGPAPQMADAYRNADRASVVSFAKAMFRYWTEEPFAAQFRRMLTLEQFRSEEMSALYQRYLVSGPLDYMTDLLAGMGCDRPRQAAAAFYGPMFLLYSVYDGADDPESVTGLLDNLLDETMNNEVIT